jgi:hypothetical protein
MIPNMSGNSSRSLIFLTLIASGVFALFSASAQQSSSDTGFIAPQSSKPKPDKTQIEKPAPYDITGVVAQAFKMKNPLQLINPLAPKKVGDGRDNVSWDPDKPEKPKGIILLGIQW